MVVIVDAPQPAPEEEDAAAQSTAEMDEEILNFSFPRFMRFAQ